MRNKVRETEELRRIGELYCLCRGNDELIRCGVTRWMCKIGGCEAVVIRGCRIFHTAQSLVDEVNFPLQSLSSEQPE